MNKCKNLFMPAIFLLTILLGNNFCAGIDLPGGPLVADKDTIGLWHFDEGQGIQSLDSSSNKHDGKLANIEGVQLPEWVDGKFGKAIKAAKGSYVEISDKWAFEDLSAITIECWVYFNSIESTSDFMPVIAKGNSFWICNALKFLLFTDGPDGENADEVNYGPIEAGRWYHVVAIYDGAKIYLIVDGQVITGQKELSGNVQVSGGQVMVGSDGGSRHGNVIVDEVRISKTARYIEPFKKPGTKPAGDKSGNTEISAAEIAKRVSDAKLFANALITAYELMESSRFKIKGMNNLYYKGWLMDINNQLASNWSNPNKHGKAGDFLKIEAELNRIENELVIESVNVFPASFYSPRRLYSVWCRWGDVGTKDWLRGLGIAKQANITLRNETKEIVLDWKRSLEGLKRNGITLDLSIEMKRISEGVRDAFKKDEKDALSEVIPDRLFEQRFGFYVAVATERQRIAAGVIQAQTFLKAWENVIQLRNQMGAKISGADALLGTVKNALTQYGNSVKNGDIYTKQLQSERAFNAAFEKFKAAVTIEEAGKPAIWPGVSFYSTGRFALGGSWQGILNSEINHNGLYRDKAKIQMTKDGKLQWAFSFTPPGASRFEMEITGQSWTHSTRRYYYPQKGLNNTATQEVDWSILAPGTLVNTPGPSMLLADNTIGSPLPPDKVVAVIKGKPTIINRQDAIDPAQISENWILLLMENGMPVFPVLVVFEQRPDAITWTTEGLEIKRNNGVGRCVVALPYGSAAQSADFSRQWKQMPEDVLRKIRAFVPLLTYYPITTEEYFAVDGDSIRVWSKVSEAVQLQSEFCTPGKPYIPLPPMYAMGLPLNLGLKVDSTLSACMTMTKYGPYQVTYEPILAYRVPKAGMRERLDLRPIGEDKDLVDNFNTNVLIGADYRRFIEVGAFVNGYLMMTPENRKTARYYNNPLELEAGMSVREMLVGSVDRQLNLDIDPVTGQMYWDNGFRSNMHDVRMQGDVPNETGFTMYGPYAYAKYFNEWDMLARNWGTFRKLYFTTPARHDWAVPSHDCDTTGYVFSGDMAGDGWRTHQMMANVASTLGGHTEEQRLAQYLGSITLLSYAVLGHPGTTRYVHRMVNYPASRRTNETFIGMRGDDLGLPAMPAAWSWHNLFAFSGCMVNDYPIYDSMLALYPETARNQFQGFPKVFTNWLEESYLDESENKGKGPVSVNAAGSATYLNYLCWTGTNKNIISEYWNKYSKVLGLQKWGTSSWFYDTMYRIQGYPYFIALGNPIWLSSWDTAKLEDGTYDRNSHEATITIIASRKGTMRLVSAVPARQITINDRAVSEKEYDYNPGKQELNIKFPEGRQKIIIKLDAGKEKTFSPGISPLNRKYQDLGINDQSPDPGDNVAIPVLAGDLKVGNTMSIDISSVANMGYYDETAGDQKGGTHDDGESWEFPKGEIKLRGVPFTFIKQEENGGKTCIVLKGTLKDFFPVEAKGIKVGKVIKRIFFLHGTAYTQKDGVALTYVLRFKGGETRELGMKVGQQIGEWKIQNGEEGNKSLPPDRLSDLPDARGSVVWPLKNAGSENWRGVVGGYIYAWENNVKGEGGTYEGGIQRGLDMLESIDIISTGNSVPMVFAITVELAE